MTPTRRAGARRLGWGITTQALSSISNFIVGIIVVRSVSLGDFGAYSIAYAFYLFVVGAFRAFGSKTFTLRYTGKDGSEQREGQRGLTGLALLCGIVVGAVGLGASALLSGTLASTVRVISVFLPFLLVQDAWRFSFVAVGRPSKAAANDLMWIGAQVALFAAVLVSGDATAPLLLAAWAGAGALAGIGGIVQARLTPSIRSGVQFMRTHRDVNWLLVGEHVVSQGANQAGLVVLGTILPLSSVGALRSGQLILSPLNVLQQAAPLVGLPEAGRARRRSPAALSTVVTRIGATLAVAAALLTIGMLLLPDSIGTAIFGDGWTAGSAILVPLGLRNVVGGLTIAAFLGLQTLDRSRTTLLIGATRGVTSFGAMVGFGAMFGLQGAVWAMAGADLLAAGLAVRAFRRAAVADRSPRGADESSIPFRSTEPAAVRP